MVYRAFGVRLVFLLGFAFMIVLVQMLAVSRLSSPSRLPWEEEGEGWELSASPHSLFQRAPAPRPDDQQPANGASSPSAPLEHENPNRAHDQEPLTKAPPHHSPGDLTDPRARINAPDLGETRAPPRDLQAVKDDRIVLISDKETRLNSTTLTTGATSLASSIPPASPSLTLPSSVSQYSLPSDLLNCSIGAIIDAVSAVKRARTVDCKDLIHNITCLAKSGQLYNADIRNTCPLGRTFGGHGFESVPYSNGKGPPIRIVYLFSVHGRAYRQLKRLFKAIYHPDHYYYFHVDSRSDYLQRELTELATDFPNVYFPTWRMATIWGGASLLQMLLRALEDLETVLAHWEWDFFINLSESDYPLKTNSDLVQFLRVHRASNFVKTHGGDINKFIQKQGLDRTFVECDNHMWRVDKRPLPPEITLDGGSDWIAINRNYSRYLVTNKDSYLTGMKKYFEFSLLPAEAFFHSVLRNGPLCPTFIKTNLRVTNWNRKLGCRCQYKHIVDWCGCSPNDYLSKDMARLKNVGTHHFFARKFEAIVNQKVINQLHAHLYGAYAADTLSLDSYWESIYHVEDDITRPSSAHFTTFATLLRASLQWFNARSELEQNSCLVPGKAIVREASVLRIQEQFKGVVIAFQDALSDRLNPPEFEVLFSPIDHSRRDNLSSDLSRRISALEVGSNWDGKESIFRNYPSMLGVWDEPVASVRMFVGRPEHVTVIWTDPVGDKVPPYSLNLDAGWSVAYHKPKLELPLRPGVWSVELQQADKRFIISRDFLVVPIMFDKKAPLKNPQGVNARRVAMLKSGIDAKRFLEWKMNVVKSDAPLEAWLDQLVGEFWKIEEVCRTFSVGNNCSLVPPCASTWWSTRYPDPKSDVSSLLGANSRTTR